MYFFEFPSLLWIFCSISKAATHEHLLNWVSWARKQNYRWLMNSALSVNAETVGVFCRKMSWEASWKNGLKWIFVLGVVLELSFLVNYSQTCFATRSKINTASHSQAKFWCRDSPRHLGSCKSLAILSPTVLYLIIISGKQEEEIKVLVMFTLMISWEPLQWFPWTLSAAPTPALLKYILVFLEALM